jgi:hypothetical protein
MGSSQSLFFQPFFLPEEQYCKDNEFIIVVTMVTKHVPKVTKRHACEALNLSNHQSGGSFYTWAGNEFIIHGVDILV